MKAVEIKEVTRERKREKIAIFFMIVLIMGLASLLINPRGSKFNAMCVRCYFCIERCPVKAISLDSHGFPIINKTKCLAWDEKTQKFRWERCGLCLRGCPTRVIELLQTNLKERELHTTS